MAYVGLDVTLLYIMCICYYSLMKYILSLKNVMVCVYV